jgi:hypothetical protein
MTLTKLLILPDILFVPGFNAFIKRFLRSNKGTCIKYLALLTSIKQAVNIGYLSPTPLALVQSELIQHT